MITIFKIFEQYVSRTGLIKRYWLVPTDDRLIKSLKEIKCDSESINRLDRIFSSKDFNYVFVGYTSHDNWGWMMFKGKMRNKWYDENGYKFMDAVNIYDGEVESREYVNKYNL
jgi:hypothetical protein